MSRVRGKATTDHQQPGPVVGIDVSKGYLDVCVHPTGERFRVRNDTAGLEDLRRRCIASLAGLVLMEATGRYHHAAHVCLHEAGIGVAIINPYRTRRFADVLGRLAKTDKIDAEVLAQFAATMRPTPTEPPPETMAQRRAVVRALRPRAWRQRDPPS